MEEDDEKLQTKRKNGIVYKHFAPSKNAEIVEKSKNINHKTQKMRINS